MRVKTTHMECKEGTSNKYYTVFEMPDGTVRSDYGRIRYFAEDKYEDIVMSNWDRAMDAKKDDADALIREKKARGYSIKWEGHIETGSKGTRMASTKEVGAGSTDSIKREFESLSTEVTDFGDDSKPTSRVESECEFVEKEIVLDKCKEAKEHVPVGEWFLDTGYLKPIAAGIKMNKPVLLKGDTGSGKTSAVRYLASVTQNGFRRVNLNGSTTVDEFVGRWKLVDGGKMEWLDGVLTECMRMGYWLLCDEINACLPEIAFVLHSVLDDDRYLVLSQKDGEIVKPHKDFRFFASMNPNYAGTHTLNIAFEDRFPIVVEMEYPGADQEMKIIMKRSGNGNKALLQKMLEVANKVRSEFKEEKVLTPFSTRRLIDWATLALHFSPAKSFAFAVINKMPREDQMIVRDIAAVVFGASEFRQKLELR